MTEERTTLTKKKVIELLSSHGYENITSEFFGMDKYVKGTKLFFPETDCVSFRDGDSGVQITALYKNVKFCQRAIHMRTSNKEIEVKVKL